MPCLRISTVLRYSCFLLALPICSALAFFGNLLLAPQALLIRWLTRNRQPYQPMACPPDPEDQFLDEDDDYFEWSQHLRITQLEHSFLELCYNLPNDKRNSR